MPIPLLPLDRIVEMPRVWVKSCDICRLVICSVMVPPEELNQLPLPPAAFGRAYLLSLGVPSLKISQLLLNILYGKTVANEMESFLNSLRSLIWILDPYEN